MSKAIYKKLFEMQKSITELSKDAETKEYAYLSDEKLLGVVRPLMDKYGLMLTVQTTGRSVRADETKSGTTRYFTEIDIKFTWVDVETDEELIHTFTAQGVDLAGEKGIGKALTYGEKYYLLKLFHIPTPKDDPDSEGAGKEKKQKGTQAAKETADLQRKSIKQIAEAFAETGKITAAEAIKFYTKNDANKYPGVESVDEISAAALPVAYQTFKAAYKKLAGHDFEFKAEGDE